MGAAKDIGRVATIASESADFASPHATFDNRRHAHMCDRVGAPLKRFTAHESRLGCCRLNAFVHDRPTQRAHALHQKQAEAARALQRQKI
jgi:hypothetical protein